jgi:hypothetical protein
MGTLFATRNQSKLIYLEYGNVYNIMNDFPDRIINPIFDQFFTSYGFNYRQNVLCVSSYTYIQYYINAMGMRQSPINFTYIDAIGADSSFGIVDALVANPLDDSSLKKLLINYQLNNLITIGRAYQLAKMNNTNLVTFTGGPYIKTPQYGWAFQYGNNKGSSQYLANMNIEIAVNARLYNMNLNDNWVAELHLDYMARLRNLGIKTIMISLLVGANTTARDFVPILSNLNATSIIYDAINQSVFNNRTSTLQYAGIIPNNPSVCSPSCVWGDCVQTTCVCFEGYNGADCSNYIGTNVQNKIGMNLQGISYWTTQSPFIDFQKEGSAWVYQIVGKGWSSGANNASQVPLDDNGYPTYLPPGIQVATLMARDVFTHYPTGTYVILYEGDGIISIGMFDIAAVRYGVGRIEVDVIPSTNMNNGILVTIEITNPLNYIRNIRVIRPGF